MCGRYNLVADGQSIMETFGLLGPVKWSPRYNIAPSQQVLAIRQRAEGREGMLLRWGLIPSWASDERISYHTINARAETVAEKPAFRDAFRRQRCIIPATGFFEWRNVRGKSQPYNIRVVEADLGAKGSDIFALAGLFEKWTDPAGKILRSCTIIVCDANEILRPIHPRMPVILHPDDYSTWLDPATEDTDTLQALLRPAPAAHMELWRVSSRVGSPAHDDAGLVEPRPAST